MKRALRSLAALAALAAPAAACPLCAVGQGGDTLKYIAVFLIAPYAITTGTWLMIKHILKSEAP